MVFSHVVVTLCYYNHRASVRINNVVTRRRFNGCCSASVPANAQSQQHYQLPQRRRQTGVWMDRFNRTVQSAPCEIWHASMQLSTSCWVSYFILCAVCGRCAKIMVITSLQRFRNECKLCVLTKHYVINGWTSESLHNRPNVQKAIKFLAVLTNAFRAKFSIQILIKSWITVLTEHVIHFLTRKMSRFKICLMSSKFMLMPSNLDQTCN